VSAQTASFTASPASFDVTGDQWGYGHPSGSIRLVNSTDSEITVAASVQNAAANRWLELPNPIAVISPRSVNLILFQCNGEFAVAGAQNTNIILTGPGPTTVQIPVTLTTQGRKFTVSPSSVTINGTERSPYLVHSEYSITNFGPLVDYTLTSDSPWLQSGAGRIGYMETRSSAVQALAQSLMAGVYQGKLFIDSPGYPRATLNVTFNVVGPTTTVSPSPLRMTVKAGESTSANVTVTTNAPLPMTVYGTSGRFWPTPEQFTSSPTVVTIRADARDYSPGTVNASLTFYDALGTSRFELPIILTVTPTAGQLVITPTTLDFGPLPPGQSVYYAQITIVNYGPALNYQITNLPSWIQVAPPTGTFISNGVVSLNPSVDTKSLAQGRHEATIMIQPAGMAPIPITIALTITAPSPVTVSPSPVSLFAPGPGNAQEVTISTPGASIQFSATAADPWLRYSPATGSLPPAGSAAVRVWADPQITPRGKPSSTLHLTVGIQDFSIPVTVNNETGLPHVTLWPSSFAPTAAAGTSATVSSEVTLHNAGAPASFAVTSNQAWLSAAPASGQLATGSSAQLSVHARAQGLAAGVHNGVLTFKAGDDTLTLPVTFTLTSPAALVVTPSSIEFTGLGSSPPARRTVSVTTQSGAPAQFTFTHQSPGDWLIAEQAAGQLSVGVNPILLSVSPATGTIQISSVPSDGRNYTVQVTARKASTPASWAMPQVADGGDFSTSITLVNPDPSPATATLRFRRNKQDGSFSTEDWRPALHGDQTLENIRVPAKSIYTLETLGSPAVTSSGWVEVTGPSRLGGFAVFRQTKPDGSAQEAAVPMSGAGLDRVVLPYDNASGWVTSFALINRDSAAPLAVNYDLRDSDGRSLSSGPLIFLPAAGHVAARFVDMFPSSAGKRGSLLLTASREAISALALRFSPQGAFTSMETTPESSPGAAVRQVFAQIADGGGFNTLLTLQNNNAAAITASIRFRRAVPGSNGATEPWSPQIEGSASTVNVLIPAGGTYAVRTAGAGDTPASGWAEVESASPLSGSAVFSFKPGQAIPQEASVALKVGQTAGFHLPFDNALGFVTSIALANLDAAAARLTVVLRDETGAVLGQEAIDIPASGHLAFETVNRLPATAGRRGSADFTIQSGWVAAIGLRFSPAGPFTSFQPQYW
jgi:hypothetical protein